MSSTATKRRRKATISLREDIVRLGKPERVDREKGILFGVKILGLESQNQRRYLPEAAKAALAMYEGLAVNVDHPKRPEDSRSAHDRFGWFENVRVAKDGGLTGDFHMLDPGDPLSVKVMNAADQNPSLFGFSHNAEGEGHTDASGVYIVEKITEVRSVDLVAEPATTNGLFEGKRPMAKIKQRKFLESTLALMPKGKKATGYLTRWLEAMPDEKLDEDMDAPADTGGSWQDMLYAAMKQCDDPDVSKKLHAMLKPEAAVAEDDGEAMPEDDAEKKNKADDDLEEDEDLTKKLEGKKPKVDPSVTQLQEEVTALKAQLQAEKDATALATWLAEECKKRKLEIDADLIESVTAGGDRKKIAARLDKLKAMIGNGHQPPRSQTPGSPILESTNAKPTTDGKSFANTLKARSR